MRNIKLKRDILMKSETVVIPFSEPTPKEYIKPLKELIAESGINVLGAKPTIFRVMGNKVIACIFIKLQEDNEVTIVTAKKYRRLGTMEALFEELNNLIYHGMIKMAWAESINDASFNLFDNQMNWQFSGLDWESYYEPEADEDWKYDDMEYYKEVVQERKKWRVTHKVLKLAQNEEWLDK